MITFFLWIITMISNPIIELESLNQPTITMSLDELHEKFNVLSSEDKAEIIGGLFEIYTSHPIYLNTLNSSTSIEYKENYINVISYFQGKRLKIYNLPLEEIKSFIFMK